MVSFRCWQGNYLWIEPGMLFKITLSPLAAGGSIMFTVQNCWNYLTFCIKQISVCIKFFKKKTGHKYVKRKGSGISRSGHCNFFENVPQKRLNDQWWITYLVIKRKYRQTLLLHWGLWNRGSCREWALQQCVWQRTGLAGFRLTP